MAKIKKLTRYQIKIMSGVMDTIETRVGTLRKELKHKPLRLRKIEKELLEMFYDIEFLN